MPNIKKAVQYMVGLLLFQRQHILHLGIMPQCTQEDSKGPQP